MTKIFYINNHKNLNKLFKKSHNISSVSLSFEERKRIFTFFVQSIAGPWEQNISFFFYLFQLNEYIYELDWPNQNIQTYPLNFKEKAKNKIYIWIPISSVLHLSFEVNSPHKMSITSN